MIANCGVKAVRYLEESVGHTEISRYGAGNYDFTAMAIPCAIVVVFAIRRPRYIWARWIGDAALVFWILMDTANSYLPF